MRVAVLDTFAPAYMQRALLEMLLLALMGGVLGGWIVLRRLAFYTHAVGAAAFPGVVVAGPLGLAPPVAAIASSIAVGAGVRRAAHLPRVGVDLATGIGLVAALALGVVLVSDVYESGSGVDRLLGGSLVAVSTGHLWITAAACAGVVLADAVFRRTWLAHAFEPQSARAAGLRTDLADRLLLAAIAVAVVIAVDAVGALLVTAILVVPAATARLAATSVRALRILTVVIGAVEGVLALVLARELDVGPGAALAVVSGLGFAAVAASRRVRT